MLPTSQPWLMFLKASYHLAAASRPALCQQACAGLTSCVYIQYEHDTCCLCINAAADVTAAGAALTSAQSQPYRTHVKVDIADVIFTSTSCRSDLMQDVLQDLGPQQNFNQQTSESNLMRVRFRKPAVL